MNILLCNHHLKEFAGSELVTLDLAVAFRRMGHQVAVATFVYDFPLKEVFERQGIAVFNLLEVGLGIKEYDLLWGHHFPVILDILLSKRVFANKIVLNSMSPFVPLETHFPVLRGSLLLFNSEENRKKQVTNGYECFTFPNSVPDSVFSLFRREEKPLRSVAVVSNHIPNEIIETLDILKDNDINSKVYGLGHTYTHVTPELLLEHDAVITIGRTTQFSLALGIPVYCYDQFGGPGWITEVNLDQALEFNFSGRCSRERRVPEVISGEILSGYGTVAKQSLNLHLIARQRFTLEKNIRSVFKIAEAMPDLCYDISDSSAVPLAAYGTIYKWALGESIAKGKTIHHLNDTINHLNDTIKIIQNSLSWRITSPLRDLIKTFPSLSRGLQSIRKRLIS